MKRPYRAQPIFLRDPIATILMFLLLSLPRTARGSDVKTIYVLTNLNGTRVTAFTPDGQQAGAPILLGGRFCDGIAVDKNGNIYVANNAPVDNLLMFAPDGKRTPLRLNLPSSAFKVAIRPSGEILVLGNRQRNGIVQAFTPSGQRVGNPMLTHTRVEANLTVDSKDRLYVVSKFENVLKTYDTKGQPGGLEFTTDLKSPHAVAVGPDGRIYVANVLAVKTFLPDGRRVEPTLSMPIGTGTASPGAVAVDRDGKIYVGYYSVGGGHGRIAIYDNAGKLVSPYISTPNGIAGIAIDEPLHNPVSKAIATAK